MRALIALLAFLLICATPLRAQDAPVKIEPRQLLVQPRGEQVLPSFWQDPSGHILARQQQFYGGLSGAIRQIKGASPWTAAGGLMLLSFGYGVFHAAGPGHGKAVISGWLLANRQQLRKGILISAMSAIIQALSAILIVSAVLAFVALAGGVARDAARATSFWLEAASYLLIMGLGVSLLWRMLPKHDHAHHHHHADHHHPGDDHTHHHHDDCGCGHAHMPAAKDVKAQISFAQSFSLALAVGIRPCTGALLVLLFSAAAGLYAAGIAATFAMALGTFITIAAIAAATVLSRDFALRLAGTESAWMTRAGLVLRAGAGILIIILGASLFMGLIAGGQRFV